jgi:phosphatidylethanolamine/phosphatidyl-N-methylethanolamine N-methyltransferase
MGLNLYHEFQRGEMSPVSPLSEIQMEFYSNYYPRLVSEGKGGRYHKFTHKLMEKSFTLSNNFPVTIEIGAGAGEHFEFVNHEFEVYYHSDIRKNQLQSEDERITQLVCDAADVPLEDGSCDRVLVTCLLHHLSDPMEALVEIRRLVKPGGIVTVLIPSDPGLLFRFLRSVSSERKLKKMGFAFGKLLHAVEHRNHVQSLREQVSYVFSSDEIKLKSWPLPLPAFWNLNLLYVYNIKKV